MLKCIIKVILVYLIFNISSNQPIKVIDTNLKTVDGKEQIVTDVVATLSIPKISLYKSLYNVNSTQNTIDKNVEIINPSSMPNIEKGNLILAAHSGNSKIAFFKDLNKLKVDDIAIINYNDEYYYYHLSNSYEVDKKGSVEIIRDNNKTCLTLITCNIKDKTKQVVYIFELEKIL